MIIRRKRPTWYDADLDRLREALAELRRVIDAELVRLIDRLRRRGGAS